MDPLDHLNDNSQNVQKIKLVWNNNLQILQKKNYPQRQIAKNIGIIKHCFISHVPYRSRIVDISLYYFARRLIKT